MSVSAASLEPTVNFSAVARHHGIETIVGMSQMTVMEMSITETIDSPRHKLHWLAEQVVQCSGLPVVTVRPTAFLESFFPDGWRSQRARKRRTPTAARQEQDFTHFSR